MVTLDCDLQNRPEEIQKMYEKALEGYDIALASRQNRRDYALKKLYSQMYYQVLSYLTDTYQDASEANFALYNCKVVNALKSMHDYFRYYPTMIHWVGFKLTKLEIEHAEREDGIKSSGNLKKRMNLAMTTIIYFSDKPLRLIVRMGILISVISALFAVALVVKYFMVDQDVSGWTSIFISIWFVLGFMITILGMVGIYVGKIFELVKLRSTYIVGERLNYEPMTEAE